MGKASKLKQIRKIASRLPDIKITHRISEPVSGISLLKAGIDEVKGVPVDSSKTYKKVTSEPISLNHNRKMKHLYNQYGPNAVRDYVMAVNNYTKNKK